MAGCSCHGSDYRGTVLSRVQGSRALTAGFDGGTVTLNLFRGALIGCYNCHNGPGNDSLNTNAVPTVNVVSGTTLNNAPLNLPVAVTPSAASLRIISAQHAYLAPGAYNWTLTASAGTASATNTGTILITSPIVLSFAAINNSVNISWPLSASDVVIEQSGTVGPEALWSPVTNAPVTGPNGLTLLLPTDGATRFFRARQPW